jgi:uncharacterized RDD family membrane protein YckC
MRFGEGFIEGSKRLTFQLVLPQLIKIAILLGLVLSFLSYSGIGQEIHNIYQMHDEYQAKQADDLRNMRFEQYSDSFGDYLEDKKYDFTVWIPLLTSNIMLILIVIGIAVIVSSVLDSLSMVLVSRALTPKGKFGDPISDSMKKLFMLVLFHAINLTFIFAPAVLFLPSIYLLANNYVLAGLLILVPVGFLYVIYILFYVFYVAIRFFWAVPAIYIDSLNPVAAIKKSWNMTKQHYSKLLLFVFINAYIISFLTSLFRDPLQTSIGTLMFNQTLGENSIALAIFLVSAAGYIILWTLGQLYVFWYYPDFDKKVKDEAPAEISKKAVYRDFWVRLLAAMLDFIILYIPFIIITLVLSLVGANMVIYLLSLLFALLIIYLDSRYGGTPGKLILGLKIVDSEGKNMSYAKAVLRYAAKMSVSMMLLLGYIWILVDKNYQGWHDRIAETFVICTK